MKKIIPVIQLTRDFAGVTRAVGYKKGHSENDSEHSFQLAVVSWSTNHQYKLGASDELILKYALIHDLVELYAGDTDAFGDKKSINLKAENERKALEKLKKNYSKFPEILNTIDKYNKRVDFESQLVYVMDKVIPDENEFSYGSRYYKDRKISVSKWKKWLFGKVAYDSLDQKIKLIVDEAVKEVETNQKEMFYVE